MSVLIVGREICYRALAVRLIMMSRGAVWHCVCFQPNANYLSSYVQFLRAVVDVSAQPVSTLQQQQMDACVQANFGVDQMTATAATLPQQPLHTSNDSPIPQPSLSARQAKAAAATLPGSTVNPMSLDYRTRTLR